MFAENGWDAIVSLCENNKSPVEWGYEKTSWGKKILAKKFELSGSTIYDFNVYRLEKMIDDSWESSENNGTDAYILAEILEAYLGEEVGIDWCEGFPMAFPLLGEYED